MLTGACVLLTGIEDRANQDFALGMYEINSKSLALSVVPNFRRPSSWRVSSRGTHFCSRAYHSPESPKLETTRSLWHSRQTNNTWAMIKYGDSERGDWEQASSQRNREEHGRPLEKAGGVMALGVNSYAKDEVYGYVTRSNGTHTTSRIFLIRNRGALCPRSPGILHPL